MITDRHVAKTAGLARRFASFFFNPTTSVGTRVFGVIKPGARFLVETLQSWCFTAAGTVSINGVLVPSGTGRISAPVVSVHSTPEQLAVTGFVAMVASSLTVKAAATGITFTAAHVVSANCFGIILIQMNSSGTISSKVPAATQAYASAGDARANCPSPDSGKIEVCRIVIDAKTASAWTANTDDMTAASDLDAITITNGAALTPFTSASAISALAYQTHTVTPGAGNANVKAMSADDLIVLHYTSDGSGALTQATVQVGFRPYPMMQEA